MTFVIEEHICGWRGMAFGGYVAGLMASKVPGHPMKVSFKARVPVGIPLDLVLEGDRVSIVQDAFILATAEPAQRVPTPPMVPSHIEVQAAAARFPAREEHPQPRCFGCGPDLPPGVGLRVFAGPSPDMQFVGAAWTPDSSFGDSRANLATECVWAALDCPAGWARNHFLPSPSPGVTAYIAAQTWDTVSVGVPHVVMGWPIRRERRKAFVGSAILTTEGRLLAAAEALWIDSNASVG